jgi:hypothetical protein
MRHTNGEEPSNGEVGTAIAGDMGDVGMRLLWGIVENKPLLRDPLCDIRTGDVPLDMQEFDLLWCWDELWWFKYVRCAIKFNFVHGMYAESKFNIKFNIKFKVNFVSLLGIYRLHL